MDTVPQAILKTLAYSDIFDYPLTQQELQEYLIEYWLDPSDKFNLTLTEGIGQNVGYFFLYGREQIVAKRRQRERISHKKLELAQQKTAILKLIPWIKLVAVTGRVAAGNAEENDDIDLLIVSAPKRLWLTRLFEFFLLSLTGQRRRADQTQNISNKLCPNMYLTEDSLALPHQDLFTANELARVKIVWQRSEAYQKFIQANQWVWNFLPNWRGEMAGGGKQKTDKKDREQETEAQLQSEFRLPFSRIRLLPSVLSFLELIARFLQLKYMHRKRTTETIKDNLLMFHPQDMRGWVMKEYQERLHDLGIH